LVRDELTNAGLPVVSVEEDFDVPGVQLDADEDGVWVIWQAGPLLVTAVGAVLGRGAYRDGEVHPALTYSGVVAEAKYQAILTILTAIGFDVQEDMDDYPVTGSGARKAA
jgi:hypothetical protein